MLVLMVRNYDCATFTSMAVLERFYEAFSKRDWVTMGACYHPHARFSDPVFTELDAEGVRAMWEMLLTSGTDLRVSYTVLRADENSGQVRWQAWYTFSRTGRAVHNIITSEFVIEDDRIRLQRDHFDFWRWSRQALGVPGLLLGWTPIIADKVRGSAGQALHRYRKHDPG